MYEQLTTSNRGKFGTVKEIENRLRRSGYIKFTDKTEKQYPDLIDKLRNADNLIDYLTTFFYINRFGLTERYSNRYERVVRGGNSDRHENTRRSITDIFMSTLYYNPKFTIEDVYVAIAKLYKQCAIFYTNICPTVRKRVSYMSFIDSNYKDYSNRLFKSHTERLLRDMTDEYNVKIDPINNRIFYDTERVIKSFT